MCLTFWVLSGTMASSGPSPHHECGMRCETMFTARSPVIFQLHDCEYLSITYSKVPNPFMRASIFRMKPR